MLSKKWLIIGIFGVILALITAILELLEYRYLVGSLKVETYTTLIATIFTAIGIWIGFNFLKSKRKKDLPSYKVDESVRKKLNLNDREFQVLELIAMGKTNKEIADTLFLALPTIKTHTSNLYGKLEVRNRTEAVIKARNLRLIK